MFERYAESSRRAVFYARYEASFGPTREIDTLDLLRGIVRESKPADQGTEWVRANMDSLCAVLWPANDNEKLARSLKEDIRLSDDAKKALAYAAIEGERNVRGVIDAATLLLGILAFQNEATDLLSKFGLTLEAAREDVRQLHERHPPKDVTWHSIAKGVLRRNRKRLLRILLFLLVLFSGVALVDWVNR